MIPFTLEEIAQAVSGTLVIGSSNATPTTPFSGVAQTDSREISQGGLFVAREGEETDGHLFASAAIEAGAALLIVERQVDERVPQIVVDDSTRALACLARAVIHRARDTGPLKIVGITGSNGKTTTKNLLATMTEHLGAVVASEKSFNNEVGGPLTMLRVQDDTEYLVAEMGASKEGEIAHLVGLAPPDIGVVLSVGLAHAGEFGGIESTFRTKSEMVRDLSESAVAVLNRDDPRVATMAELTAARVRWFGLTDAAHVWAGDVESDATGTAFTLHLDGALARVKFPVLGEHHVMNALAASAVASELGLDLPTIVSVLESTTRPARWRMEVMGGRDDITIINDAYNASPDSMSAALKTLAQVRRPNGRAIAVLGAMSELGEFSGEQHDRIGLLAVRLGLAEVIVVGLEARRLHISTINEGSWDGESVFFEDQDSAYEYLLQSLRPEDTVLVKSSNSAGLRFLGDRLGEEYS